MFGHLAKNHTAERHLANAMYCQHGYDLSNIFFDKSLVIPYVRVDKMSIGQIVLDKKTRGRQVICKPFILSTGPNKTATHRYLGKVDCSKNMRKIHLDQTRVLVAGTKHSRQAKNRLGNLECPVCLPSCSARLPCWLACFVLWPLLALTFQRVFLQRPLTKLTKKARQVVHAFKLSIS